MAVGFKPLHCIIHPQFNRSCTCWTLSKLYRGSQASPIRKGKLLCLGLWVIFCHRAVTWIAGREVITFGNGGQKPEESRPSLFCSARQCSPLITTGLKKTHFKRVNRISPERKTKHLSGHEDVKENKARYLLCPIWALDTMRLPHFKFCISCHQSIYSMLFEVEQSSEIIYPHRSFSHWFCTLLRSWISKFCTRSLHIELITLARWQTMLLAEWHWRTQRINWGSHNFTIPISMRC